MGRELNKSGPAYFLDHVLIKWDGMHSLIAKEDEEHILITRPDGEDSFVIILTKSDLLGMLGMLKKPTYVDK